MPMSRGHAVVYSASLGAFVPCMFMAIRSFSAITIGGFLDEVQFALWPTSIWLIAAAGGGRVSLELHAISILANVVLYSALGLLLWVGFAKSNWVLVAIGAFILTVCVILLAH